MTYKDDLKTKIIEKLLLKSNVLTAVSSSPSDDKLLTEKATVDYVDSKIEEAGRLIGDP